MAPAPAGSETILVVEDDPGVLRFVSEVLREGGYSILEASDAAEALRRAGEHGGAIHLLVTDVVLPGPGGPQLADQLALSRPGTEVLFISGYSEDNPILERRLAEGALLLSKPFSPVDLKAAVRRALGGRVDRPRG